MQSDPVELVFQRVDRGGTDPALDVPPGIPVLLTATPTQPVPQGARRRY